MELDQPRRKDSFLLHKDITCSREILRLLSRHKGFLFLCLLLGAQFNSHGFPTFSHEIG